MFSGAKERLAAFSLLSLLFSGCAAAVSSRDEVISKAIDFARSKAVVGVDDEKIIAGAIEGALKAIDPHSSYISAQDRAFMEAEQSGHYAGVGMMLDKSTGVITVASLSPGAPAEKAGMKTGDIITHIEGSPTPAMTPIEAATLIRGAEGTTLAIRVYRKEQNKLMEFSLTREAIKSEPVTSRLIGKDIGYVRLISFISKNTATDMEVAIARLQQQAPDGISGYILDLRNNPGGLLFQATAVSDDFIDNDGPLVYRQNREGIIDGGVRAKTGDIINGAPLIVLVNGGSASASEVVAGALQDYERATILGTKTFGKGSVQNTYAMSDIFPDRTDAIKITTHLYLTPSRRSIQGLGITPDILFEDSENSQLRRIFSEADYKGAIANPTGPAETHESEARCTPTSRATPEKALLDIKGEPDYQLICAVEYLRKEHKTTRLEPILAGKTATRGAPG